MKTNRDLKVLRVMAGFTQQQAARGLGVSRRTYDRIEKGHRAMTAEEEKILRRLFEENFQQLEAEGI